MKTTIIAATVLTLASIAPASAQAPAPLDPIGSFFGAIVFGTATMVQGAFNVVTSPIELVRPAFAAPLPPPPPAPRSHRHAR